jgi:outer membrane protein assembly factor BamB
MTIGRRAMVLGIAAVAIATALPCTALEAPETEWSTQLEGIGGVSPIAYPSAAPDSVVIGGSGRVVRLDGKGGVIFDATFGPEGGDGLYDPVPADLDGDGMEEIVAGHKAGFVYGLDAADGTLLWEYNLDSPLDSWEMATAADLDGDGKAEVLACNLYGWIVCLNGDGTLRWRSKVEDYRPSTPAVADINNDGTLEIVYGTTTRHLIALDVEGHVIWNRFEPPHHLGRTIPLVADLNADGAVEIYSMSSMIGPDVGLVSVNGSDGTHRWTGATLHKAYLGRSAILFPDGSRGVLACDKGNNVGAFQADGRLRWRTQVSGRGIWSPPAVADIDGDGAHEVVVTVRGTSIDQLKNSWYIVDTEGQVLGAYQHGEGFGSALVGDIDNDGVLEVVLTAKDGKVSAFSFGGKATPEAVFASVWQTPGCPVPPATTITEELDAPAAWQFIDALPTPRFGNNPVLLSLPEETRALAVEVTTTMPDGTTQTQVFKAEGGAREVMASWPVFAPGRHVVALRLLDADSGAALGAQTLRCRVKDVTAELAKARDEALDELRSIREQAMVDAASQAPLTLAHRAVNVETAFGLLAARVTQSPELDTAGRDALAGEVDAFLAGISESRQFAALLLSEMDAGREPRFALWQDANPWDNTIPRSTLPDKGGPLTIDAWAFGNEIESVCVNAVNLTSEGMTLRVEPGTVTREGDDKPLMPAHRIVGLHQPTWLPSKFNEIVPDVLPRLGDGYTIDIAPGEVQQLWLNLHTAELEPGIYNLTWPVRTLDSTSFTTELTIRLEVSTVALPEKSRFLAGYWSRNKLGEFSTVPDLNEHLQTLWYGIPLPGAKADAKGALVGELDWTAHDAVVTQAKQVDQILYGGLPTPSFPKSVVVTDELRLTAQRNYVNAVVTHLRTLGLDYENFMVYVEDEPGLNGTVEHYMERAKSIKAIDPRIQNYANPWGAITTEMIEEMWPVTDVWQPGMETIEFLGPEYVAAMKKGGKRVATYTPPGNCRILRPLGFYRSQPWLAWHWGIEGGGWWVYNQGTDLWGTAPDREPDYGGVTYDGRSLVTSRRWEAMRDGIEDFNALCLLKERAETADDAEALRTIEEAVAHVAGEALTGVPREAADYDLDYAALMEHRAQLRAALERVSMATK